jgi:CHAT domain-containing protein
MRHRRCLSYAQLNSIFSRRALSSILASTYPFIMRIHIILFCVLLTFTVQVAGQRPGAYNDTSIYKIYGEQLASMLGVRGLDPDEIREVIRIYEENKISSDENLASLLSKLYPSDRKIGILFYFFNNDTLRTVFFEPGIIKEKKYTAIKREKLLQLSADFNHVLGLYAAADKRMPVKRGVIIKPPPASKGLTYNSLIKTTTELLLPKSFDSSYKHLLIIPSVNIGTLPFHLLSPYTDGTLLIDKCSFTVIPSLVDMLGLRVKVLRAATRWHGDITKTYNENNNLREFDSTFFSLENPLFVSNPAYPVDSGFIFPNLPGAKKEIDNAIPFAKKYRIFEGADAIKDSIMKYLGEADLAYFATHGMADSLNPKDGNFLVLSGKDPFLTVRNIMEIRKQYEKFPEMVILSACQTGLGKPMDAGMVGLSRAFLLSGANHVIMSLWNVDDEATAYLMNRFLYHLQRPSRFMPAEPMRQAALDTRKKFPKPSQWASFSLFGIDY